jgi:hypothetical protein
MGDDLDFFEWYAFVDSYNRVEKKFTQKARYYLPKKFDWKRY